MSLTTVNSRYGKIVCDTNDKYLSRSLITYGEFSEGECTLFKSLIKPDMVVVDVGANFGAHTLLFSQLAGQVFAFEPQNYVFDALCQTIKLNNLTNVTAVKAAVGTGGKVFKQDILTDVENNFGAYSFLNFTEGEEMDTYVLDIPCHFLKIDVEGMEVDVLKGAEKMIREYRPIIYVENDREDNSDNLIRTLNNMGYRCYWDCPPLYNEDNFYGVKENIFPNMGSLNMLCVDNSICIENAVEAAVGSWGTFFHNKWQH